MLEKTGAGATVGASAPPLVEMRGITKAYGRVQALRGVDFTVRRGEIVGLLGDNGAGKSTLIKILSGAVRATSGTILVNGEAVRMDSTNDAIRHRIETIYQDSALVPQLSIARNLFLGREPTLGFGRLDHKTMREVSAALLKRVGISKNLPPETPVGMLSGGERQAVAIARAMHFSSELIVLDEPTNNLGVAETRGVLNFVRHARDSGHACVLIAHNIYHVFQVVTRIVVMRRGQVVTDNIDPARTSVEEVERVITGMDEFH